MPDNTLLLNNDSLTITNMLCNFMCEHLHAVFSLYQLFLPLLLVATKPVLMKTNSSSMLSMSRLRNSKSAFHRTRQNLISKPLRIHTHVRTYLHTDAHAYAHTHKHTHTYIYYM